MRKLRFLLPQFMLILLISLPILLHAGTTGKIRGKVIDEATGEPLPGVNVFLSHVWRDGNAIPISSHLGAASNVNGEFFILRVPPATYLVTAKMMGYQADARKKVRVSVDRTSTLVFKLKEVALDLGQELVVEAKRDIIQLDVASTENYISEQDYQDTPFANRVEDVLAMQSGISGNIIEGEISIREGDTREIGVMMDGMLMVDKKFNRPVISINPGIVQEIKVMRNGFNAEYGQSRSGMINIITKNPDDKFSFSIDYQFEPARQRHYGQNRYDPNHHSNWYWKLLDGPNKYEGDSLYLNQGIYSQKNWKKWMGWNELAEKLNSNSNPDDDLTAEEAYELWKWRHRPISYGNKTGHNLDLSFSGSIPYLPIKTNFLTGFKYEYHPFTFPQSRGHYDEKVSSLKLISQIMPDMKFYLTGFYSEVHTVTQGWSNSEWSEEDRISYSGGSWEIYYPYRKPLGDRYTALAGMKFVHTLSSTAFYEINLNYWSVRWHIGPPDSARVEDGRVFHGRLYYDPHSGWIPKEKGVPDLGLGGITEFKMSGGAYTWDDAYNRRIVLNSFYTNQFHPAHEMKTGFEFEYDIVHQNRLFWDHESQSEEYTRKHHARPFELSAFIQDKIEFKGMVANIGVRVDYFNTNTSQYDIHRVLDHDENDVAIWNNDSLLTATMNGTYPKYRAKPQYYISPRIGISHPLTENSKIYFNYGHFVQTPPTEGLYQLTTDGANNRVQWMGNGELTFEKNIAYELGYDHNIGGFFQLHIGTFYKDYHDHASGMVYAHSDQSLVLEWAGQRENREIRGIEIEFRKSYGRWITGWLNYSLSKKSTSDLEIPELSDIPIITDNPSVGLDGELSGVPMQDVRELVPYARGIITFAVPDRWGPKVSDLSVLGNTALSCQLFYRSGNYLDHPDKEWRKNNPNVRFREIPRYWANMRLSRLIRYNTIQLECYMDVSNIFHSKFRYAPGDDDNKRRYFTDLYDSNRLDQVGTDKLTNQAILNTDSDNVYAGKYKHIIFGIRVNL